MNVEDIFLAKRCFETTFDNIHGVDIISVFATKKLREE